MAQSNKIISILDGFEERDAEIIRLTNRVEDLEENTGAHLDRILGTIEKHKDTAKHAALIEQDDDRRGVLEEISEAIEQLWGDVDGL
ncbi:MAG: hypothetical protein GY849_17725 [Deltaproteobacteria bacterium]|nr:hypothetical protein [Deltaproteobacteria bacterium]